MVGIYSLYALMVAKKPDHARWNSPILFDGPVRDGLRVHGADALDRARLVGDVLAIAPIVYVTAVDSLIVPLARGSADVAWQMSMMNIEAFAVSGAITSSMFLFVGRARPSSDECAAGTTDDRLCNSGRYADFPSGHTSSAMTAAGLTCAHHQHLDLYGGGLGDTLACVSSVTVALGAGVMRLIGDRHYASDVLVGGIIGFLAGYGLPSLLHYRERPLEEVYRSNALRVAVLPGAGVTPFGGSLLAAF